MTKQHLPMALALLLAPCEGHADTLVLRSGKEISGTFLGATARQIEFLPASGNSIKVGLDTVVSVNFVEVPVAASPPARQATSASRKSIVLPAGTTIRVRTT